MFMALRAIFRAPFTVKATHVIYNMDHVWIVNMGHTEATATCHVPPAVKTAHVTLKMVHV